MSESREIREVSETAALYAVGGLSGEEARAFEARLQSGCPYCMAELNQCQRAVEDLLLAVPQVAPPEGVKAKLMDRIASIPVEKQKPEITRSGEGNWIDQTTGVRFKWLKGKRTLLVKMDPGSVYPSHQHHYDEQCIVMEGSIQDKDGNVARAGDFVFMAKGSTHAQLFTETGALFLVAYT